MTRHQKAPLRQLSEEERQILEQVSRSTSVSAVLVVRARQILAVAVGQSYSEAAVSSGRKNGDAVSRLVARFNEEGVEALVPRHGGGFVAQYRTRERERILQEVRRPPDREQDGTASWSLTSLQRALRSAADGLPNVSTYTILGVLQEAGWRWQENRRWCQTGQVIRKRKAGKVTVTDPDSEAKKTD
jgi:Homeodomain-like domain